MFKRFAPVLICLMAATVAAAQPGGGGGGGRGGRGGGGRGGGAPSPSPPKGPAAARAAPKPFNQPEIIGVVKSIDADAGRLTIAYDTVEALGWPPGTQPFPVAKTALLSGVTVGEKIRFTLDSGSIATLRAFDAQ
jgi:Cu/Ag efflux protein CusF